MRYAIVSRNDLAVAMRKPEISEKVDLGHEIGHTAQTGPTEAQVQHVN